MTEPTTDVTDRLRDALHARTATVVPDPRAYERVVARRTRRRLRAWTGAGTAVLATAAVIAAVVLVATPKPVTLPPATSPAPAPAHFMAVTDGKAAVYDSDTPSTGYQGFNPAGDTVTAVTAQGDDFHFWSAAVSPKRCASQFTALEHEGPNTTARDLKGGSHVAGKVSALAVTLDGSRLAYVMTTGATCATTELHVRDLRTGADRAWRFRAGATDASLRPSLSWAPDARRLVYLTGCCDVRVLDTTAPGDDLLAPPARVDEIRDLHPEGPPCEARAAAFRGATGQLVVGVHCVGDAQVDVVPYDPETGRLGKVLFTVPGDATRLAFDRSGDHAFAETSPASVLLRWDRDRGASVSPVETGKYRVTDPVW